VFIHEHFSLGFTLIELSRLYVSLAVLLTTIVLIPIGRRLGGHIGAWAVAFLWTLSPLSFLHGRLALQDPFSALFLAAACGYIFLRPQRREGRESLKEICLLICAGGAVVLAVLNKVTAVFELPWLLGAYVCEQRARRERFLSGAMTRGLSACFLVISAILFYLVVQGSLERMIASGHASSGAGLKEALQGGALGMIAFARFIQEYFGRDFGLSLMLVFSLVAVFKSYLRLFPPSYAVTLLLYCFGYSYHFYGRYLFPSLVPLSMLLAHASEVVFARYWSRHDRNSPKGVLEMLPYFWCGAFIVCGARWIGELSTVVRDL
jgi:4-amino-4-deoxy-L-arabinose transferase-like glycosyltransferase